MRFRFAAASPVNSEGSAASTTRNRLHVVFVQQPRDRQPVAAVVAFAAQDHDALAVDRIELAHHLFHHAMRRVLHQRDAGDAVFDGEAVHLAHLLRGQYFHAETSSL